MRIKARPRCVGTSCVTFAFVYIIVVRLCKQTFLPWCLCVATAYLLAAKYVINDKMADRQSAVENAGNMWNAAIKGSL